MLADPEGLMNECSQAIGSHEIADSIGEKTVVCVACTKRTLFEKVLIWKLSLR